MGGAWKLWLRGWIVVILSFTGKIVASEMPLENPTSSPVFLASNDPHTVFTPATTTFFDLPLDVINIIVKYLDVTSFCVIRSSSSKLQQLFSSEVIMEKQKLRTNGFLLLSSNDCVPTEEGEIALKASSTLFDLWSQFKYAEILVHKSTIVTEMIRAAPAETDRVRCEVLLRQLVMLGHISAIEPWRDTLSYALPIQALEKLLYVFVNKGEEVLSILMDDLVSQVVNTSVPMQHTLFHTKAGIRLLKQFCIFGSAEIIALLGRRIQEGVEGFQRDGDVSSKIIELLNSGNLPSNRSVVVHKKHRKKQKYRQSKKITLQDLLPQIMSAIDARKYDEGNHD